MALHCLSTEPGFQAPSAGSQVVSGTMQSEGLPGQTDLLSVFTSLFICEVIQPWQPNLLLCQGGGVRRPRWGRGRRGVRPMSEFG